MLPELSEAVGSASLSVASVVDLLLGRVHHVLEHPRCWSCGFCSRGSLQNHQTLRGRIVTRAEPNFMMAEVREASCANKTGLSADQPLHFSGTVNTSVPRPHQSPVGAPALHLPTPSTPSQKSSQPWRCFVVCKPEAELFFVDVHTTCNIKSLIVDATTPHHLGNSRPCHPLCLSLLC